MIEESAGYVYVLEFSTGQIKVGRTAHGADRVHQHVLTAARYGLTVVNTWISPQHYEYAETERRLIDLCHELGGQVAATAKEYFAGLSFSAVTTKAARWRYITPGPGQPAQGAAMEHVRKNFAFLASQAAEGRRIVVTNHGRPYIAFTATGGASMPDLAEIDQRMRDAINAGDDQTLTELADEIEQAGLPLLALNVRTRKSAGLRAALTSLPGSAT